MLTLIMSPVRFQSIEERLQQQVPRRDSVTNNIMSSDKSGDSTREAAKEFSKQQQNPLQHNGDAGIKPGITFAAQDKLEKLPIPDLDATCRRYLLSLDPLQTAREHHDSERAVDEFLRTDGPGLQEKLKQYATGRSSYIEQFCEFFSIRNHHTDILTDDVRV